MGQSENDKFESPLSVTPFLLALDAQLMQGSTYFWSQFLQEMMKGCMAGVSAGGLPAHTVCVRVCPIQFDQFASIWMLSEM